MSTWPVKKFPLSPPPLSDLRDILLPGLKSNFKDVTVQVTPCPDLRLPPFHLAAAGLSGHERIADIGGPPNLHPLPKFDRKYSLLSLTQQMEMSASRGFILGAGAGPFHVVGVNSELAANLSYAEDGRIENLSHVARIDEQGSCVCERVKGGSTECALMANLFGCEGVGGEVLRIEAKVRTGKMDFIATIQHALRERYGEMPVSMGGVFVIKRGKARLHVMPDFSEEPLDLEGVKNWLRFFEMRAPLVCLTVFHSFDPGLDLRMEHTHCFSEHGEGGHYHYDTTPDEVEYEAYLNTAKIIYRIDCPEHGGPKI